MKTKSDRNESGNELLVAERMRALTEANEALMRELAELRRSMERRALDFRLIVDSIPVPVAVTTPTGDVEGLNQATLDYFGKTLQELKGWKTSDAVHPEDLERTIAALQAAHIEGRTYDVELRHRRADGVYRWFNTVGLPVRDAEGRILRWLHLLIDIDDRHRADEALREGEQRYRDLQSQLAHANRIATIGQLSAWIAHDVRQPLVGIVASADAALRWLSADQPDVPAARRALDRVVREGHRAAEVLDRIRALVKKAQPQREAVDMNALVEETITLITPEADRKGIAVHADLARSLPPVLVDRIQIQQVLMNLVVNAIQAMSSATAMKPRELLVTSAVDSSGSVLVTVRDSGPGIPLEHRDQLFDAFFTTKAEGLGMGLAICRTIVESFAGRIWMTPNTPRGAAFHFTVP